MRSEAELAYAAGLIDGEGYVTIIRNTTGRISYVPKVRVNNTSRPLVAWLAEHFGGNVLGPYKSFTSTTGKRGKDHYAWERANDKAVAFLVEVQPYLIAKRRLANLVIYTQGFKQRMRRPGRKPQSPVMLAHLAQCREVVNNMNRRGREAA